MEQGGFSSVSSVCHFTSLQPNKSKVGDSLQFFLGNNPSNQPANRERHRSRRGGGQPPSSEWRVTLLCDGGNNAQAFFLNTVACRCALKKIPPWSLPYDSSSVNTTEHTHADRNVLFSKKLFLILILHLITLYKFLHMNIVIFCYQYAISFFSVLFWYPKTSSKKHNRKKRFLNQLHFDINLTRLSLLLTKTNFFYLNPLVLALLWIHIYNPMYIYAYLGVYIYVYIYTYGFGVHVVSLL